MFRDLIDRIVELANVQPPKVRQYQSPIQHEVILEVDGKLERVGKQPVSTCVSCPTIDALVSTVDQDPVGDSPAWFIGQGQVSWLRDHVHMVNGGAIVTGRVSHQWVQLMTVQGKTVDHQGLIDWLEFDMRDCVNQDITDVLRHVKVAGKSTGVSKIERNRESMAIENEDGVLLPNDADLPDDIEFTVQKFVNMPSMVTVRAQLRARAGAFTVRVHPDAIESANLEVHALLVEALLDSLKRLGVDYFDDFPFYRGDITRG